MELHLLVIMPASGSSLCSSLSPVLLAHKSSWKTLTLFVDWCRDRFHLTRKSCFLASVGWGQCSGLPAFLLSIHRLSVCHSLSISGLVAVPFLYSTFQLLCMPPLPYREGFFLCQEPFFTMRSMACLLFSPSNLCVPSVFPFHFSIKISVYGFLLVSFLFLPQVVLICFLLWEIVVSENVYFKLKNMWSWGENIVLGGINSWGEDIVLEGINRCHHLVHRSLAEEIQAAGSAHQMLEALYVSILSLWFSSIYWNDYGSVCLCPECSSNVGINEMHRTMHPEK